MVRGSRFEIFPIQMNLSEFGHPHQSPAPHNGLWQTVGGYMRGKEEKRKKGKKRTSGQQWPCLARKSPLFTLSPSRPARDRPAPAIVPPPPEENP